MQKQRNRGVDRRNRVVVVVVVVAVVLHGGEALSYVGRSIFRLAAADTRAGVVHLRQMDIVDDTIHPILWAVLSLRRRRRRCQLVRERKKSM